MRFTGRRIALFALAVVAVVVVAPIATLELIVSRGKRCFAEIEAPRAGPLPSCETSLSTLRFLERVPFMGSHAKRIREETQARGAAMRYLDAAIGAPDPEAQKNHFAPLRELTVMLDDSSGRLRFDELGPPLATPYPGNLAASVGDDASLDSFAFSLTQHYNNRVAMRAALLRGDLARSVRLARHYAGRPNIDLRVTIGALLCAGGLTERGLEQTRDIAKDRAADRTANFSRHFGNVRVVVEACSHLGGVEAGPVPHYGYAGVWNERARVMAMRMRQLRAQHPGCDWANADSPCRTDKVVKGNIDHILDLLTSGQTRDYRLELVAVIADAIATPDDALTLAVPRKDEPTLDERVPRYASDWLTRADDQPFVTAARWAAAAKHLASLDEPKLDAVVQSMRVRAAIGHVLAGEQEAAADLLASVDRSDRKLLLANAALIGGDRAEARRRLDDAPGVEAMLLRAELAIPDIAAATEFATSAWTAAVNGGQRRAAERAAWLRLALGDLIGSTLPSPRVPVLASPDIPMKAAAREDNLVMLFSHWEKWLGASTPAERRAARWTVFRHRSDAPDALLQYMHVLGKLIVPKQDGDTETWLAAALARDREAFALRRYAFARWRAATWRFDADATKTWRHRLQALNNLSQDRDRAELLGELRL